MFVIGIQGELIMLQYNIIDVFLLQFDSADMQLVPTSSSGKVALCFFKEFWVLAWRENSTNQICVLKISSPIPPSPPNKDEIWNINEQEVIRFNVAANSDPCICVYQNSLVILWSDNGKLPKCVMAKDFTDLEEKAYAHYSIPSDRLIPIIYCRKKNDVFRPFEKKANSYSMAEFEEYLVVAGKEKKGIRFHYLIKNKDGSKLKSDKE
jgi:hypothetical protein